jgi:hypothetical protein
LPTYTLGAHVVALSNSALAGALVGGVLNAVAPRIAPHVIEIRSARFAVTRPAKSSACSTLSRASSACLIFRPWPRPLQTPVTLPLKLSKADADSTCEHQHNQAGEAVLVLGSNLRANEHLLSDSVSDILM